MKILLLFCFVSICTSFPTFFEKYLNIREDGTSTFTNTNGGMMDIMRRFIDPSKKDITLKNQRATPETSRFDDSTNDLSEGTLRNILETSYPTFQGYNQADSFHGAVDDKSYNMFKNWDTEYPVDEISDVSLLPGAVGESDDLKGSRNSGPVKEDIKLKLSKNLRSLPQLTPEVKAGQQEEYLPIKDTLYQTFGDSYGPNFAYLSSKYQQEKLPIMERLQQWTAQQKLVNHKVDQLVEHNITISQKLRYQQRLLNQEVQKIIIELVYKQALINRQIQQFVEQRQVVPQVLLAEQRFIYQQVQYMLEQLVYQKASIIDKFHRVFASGRTPQPEFSIQHKFVYEQVQQLIKQVLNQQNYLRQQIQVGAVVPQELLIFQKKTYQQVELYIQSLIKELVHQQAYFKDLFQFFVQNKQPIPQELVPQQTMVCIELTQLIRSADYVPQDLVNKEQRLHYEIILLLEEAHALSQTIVSQWAPQQWIPTNVRQLEYLREMFAF